MFRNKIKKGFSLVELLVVITIIAILSVVAYTAVGGQTIKARDSKRKQDLNTIQSALELFFVEYSRYPASLASGAAPTAIPKKFLSDIPTDPGPGGHSYRYAVSGATFEIAATLENDGDLAKYEAYIVGNSDDGLTFTDADSKYYIEGPPASLGSCTVHNPPGTIVQITAGTIGTAAAGNCIPYDPLNP